MLSWHFHGPRVDLMAVVLQDALPDGRAPSIGNRDARIAVLSLKELVRRLETQRITLGSNSLVVVQWPHPQYRPDGTCRLGELNSPIGRLIGYCNRSRSQLCHYLKKNGEEDIGDVQIIHWCSPYQNPRDKAKTEYWVNSQSLGIGEDGFQSVLRFCETTREPMVVFARSRYTTGGSWDLEEVPFDENEMKKTEEAMNRRGVKTRWLDAHMFDIFPGD